MFELLLSVLSIAGLYLYLKLPLPGAPVSSVFFMMIIPFYYLLWSRVTELTPHRRATLLSVVFTFGFSVFTVAGKLLDHSMDAMTWYLSFSDPSVPVAAQWSPLYAGLFYAFVHTGYTVTASYIPGMALFSFPQMVFIPCVVHRILVFCAERSGKRMLLASTLFFSLLPPLDRLLLLLFRNADHSYGGDVSSYFNAIPVIGPICRASLVLLFTWLSLFFGPVIVYRYYAPVIFSMPVIISVFLHQRSLSQSIMLRKERAQDE